MNVNVESTSALRRKLTIELEPGEIREELDRSYNQLRRTVHLRGFRPGHAPRHLLERFFGDQVRGEAIQKLIKESTDKALSEQGLKPVAEPEIITEESDLSKALRFSVTFDVKPEFAVKDYVGLKIQKATVTVSEEQVDSALEGLRERMATLKKIEGRSVVEPGDVVLSDLEGFAAGKPIAGSRVEAGTLEVSAKRLAHGLHEVLIGAEVGKPIVVRKSYPADYNEPDLAGKQVEWHATVKEIFERQVPALDDEFAKDQGEFETLAELREKLRADLLKRAQEEARERARQGLLELIMERNPIEVPASLLERELKSLESQAALLNQIRGMQREQAIERARQDRDELRRQAEKRARGQLMLDAIADQERIEVDDDELAERVAQMVQRERERESAAAFYAKEENRHALRQSMRREKALEQLMSRAQQDDEQSETQAQAVVDSGDET